jgi:hypothetical protein
MKDPLKKALCSFLPIHNFLIEIGDLTRMAVRMDLYQRTADIKRAVESLEKELQRLTITES